MTAEKQERSGKPDRPEKPKTSDETSNEKVKRPEKQQKAVPCRILLEPETITSETVSSYIEHLYHDISHKKVKYKAIKSKEPYLDCECCGSVPVEVTNSIPTPTYTESITFSPDGTLIACCCYDEILLYNINRDEDVVARLGHDGNVWRCCFHPAAPELFSVCGKGKLYIWNVGTWQLKESIQVSEKCLFGVNVHTHTSFLAVSGFDNIIHVYDIDSRKKLATLKAHLDSVEHIVFSPDGYTLASISKDKDVRLWDSQAIKYHTGDKIKSELLGCHGHWVLSATFTKAGKRLVTASADGVIKVWCLVKMCIQKTWVGHNNIVWSCGTVLLSNGTEAAVTASSDGTLR